jgi:hypothetical protein
MNLFWIETIGIYNKIFRIRWLNISFGSYERSVLTINDEFPCPRIIVDEGDLITIHWHGLSQMNSLDMDGVPGITQCPIFPNESLVYMISLKDHRKYTEIVSLDPVSQFMFAVFILVSRPIDKFSLSIKSNCWRVDSVCSP